jgi:hypothetical protein
VDAMFAAILEKDMQTAQDYEDIRDVEAYQQACVRFYEETVPAETNCKFVEQAKGEQAFPLEDEVEPVVELIQLGDEE